MTLALSFCLTLTLTLTLTAALWSLPLRAGSVALKSPVLGSKAALVLAQAPEPGQHEPAQATS